LEHIVYTHYVALRQECTILSGTGTVLFRAPVIRDVPDDRRRAYEGGRSSNVSLVNQNPHFMSFTHTVILSRIPLSWDLS
jgi:hypothetical protein